MRPVHMSTKRRILEIVCVLFGHSWNEYGITTDHTGRLLEEYSKCGTCGLENHFRPKYIRPQTK